MDIFSFPSESVKEFWGWIWLYTAFKTPKKQYTKDKRLNMEAVQTANPPGFESVRAILREITESQKENAIQLEKMRERQKKTERIVERNAQIIGRLGLRMGEVVEYLVAPNLREKFTEFGLDFTKVNPGSYINDRVNNISLEIDVMLENGDKAMLVEAKTKPSTVDVKEHIKRLEKMRKYADLHGDKRTFLGAVAGVVMTDNVKNYALNQGFFVMEPSGETFKIIPPNKPKEF
jgi:hypothetical protein